MPMPSNDLSSRLHALADPAYRLFQCKLMPTVPTEQVWGVRTPQLRALAKEAAGTPEAAAFLAALPHAAYDENNLHGALLCLMRDYDACLAAVEVFLPYIDNWATCDMLSPRVFARHTDALLAPIRRWMASPHVYTCRFGMGMLMRYYLEPAAFHPEYLQWVAAIRSDEYYINMMIAWFFARLWPSNTTQPCPIWSVMPSLPGRTARPFKRRWKAIAFPMRTRPICAI